MGGEGRIDGYLVVALMYFIWGLFVFSMIGGWGLVTDAWRRAADRRWRKRYLNRPKKRGNERGAI